MRVNKRLTNGEYDMKSTLSDDNGYRKVSNRKNIIKIIMGISLLISAGIEVVITVLVLKKAWMTNLLDILAVVVIITGAIILLFGIIDFVFVNKENEYLRKLPYRFDYVAEWESYKMIGKKKKEKSKFAYYEKFSVWQSYIEQEYANRKNNVDFYRFLNRKLRGKKDEKELMLNLMIPFDITVLTVFFTVKPTMSEIEMIISLSGFGLLLVIFSTINICQINEEIYFLEDFMILVFPELHNGVIQDNKKQNR